MPESPSPIVIAYDGSAHARSAVIQAAHLFSGHPAVVISAWRSVADVMPASVIAIPASVAHDAQIKMDEAARTEAQSLADAGAAIAREEGLDARGEAVEAHGTIWPCIVRAADEKDAATVVVGSRGLSAMKSALLGSVSAGVVHHSSRPVLVVHTAEDTQPGP
jgi:nucleotide-binding universal stress UspA family protein